ncbi:hypothetical protein MRX96_022095 [Rhipicephalus microplus]
MTDRPLKIRRIATSGSEGSSSSVSYMNYPAPCTSRESRPCDIFGNIHFWNEFFWLVGVGLRELCRVS